jgi:DNA-binding NarL/FixJ family response regulator
MAHVKTQLTEGEFQSEYAAGSAMNLDQAVSYAQDLSQKASAFRGSQKIQDKLSAREREVAEWIAQGISNADIAARMVVSKRTIEKHIAHILDKLGLENRAQIVRWVFENGRSNTSS